MTCRAGFQLMILVSVSCVNIPTEASPEPTVCEGCQLLSTSEDATCSDFDPVTCKDTDENVTTAVPDFDAFDICSKDSLELCSPSKTGDASGPSCVLDQVPDDMHLELHYDGKSKFYDVKLTWPSLQLPPGCIEDYHVLDYIGKIADPSLSCEDLEEQYPACADFTNDTTIAFRRSFEYPNLKYITLKVVAYPVYVWSVTFRVGDGVNRCIARCGGCSCQYPSSPTNLTWTPDKDTNGMGRLSWKSEDHTPVSYYYLHLNSSTSGKLLYRIDGTESSVMLHNVVGNVTAWMESYGFECGCSNSSSSKVLLMTTDVPPSTTTSPTTPLFTASSTSPTTTSPTTSTTPITMSPTTLLFTASSTSPTVTVENTGSGNRWLAIALPVVLAMVILLVVLLVISGIIVIQRHRHNIHTRTFFSKVEICRTFSKNDEKKKDQNLHVENCCYEKSPLPPYKPSTENGYTFSVTVMDTDEGLPRKNGCLATQSPYKLSSNSSSSHQYVLLVFSQETPPGDQDFIRAYAQLLNKKVSVKMYDASDRLTRTAWLEDHYRSAVAILCVCNAAFAREWSNLSTPSGGSIVSAVRMMVQGKIEHQKRLEKFAVLHLHQEDTDFTPPYLENVKSFLLSRQQIDSIAHFALSIKEFDYQ